MRIAVALLGVLLLTGCQVTNTNSGENDPKYPWWELAFIKPNFMNVWVEDSSVEDINGKTFLRAGAAFFKVVVASPSNYAALFSVCCCRSGFNITVPIGSQFLVCPDQRSGHFSRACSYSS